MQKVKKTEPITFRTSKETKAILQIMADQRDWTISQLVERTITNMAMAEKKSWSNKPENISEDELLTKEELIQKQYDEEKHAEEEREKEIIEELKQQ